MIKVFLILIAAPLSGEAVINQIQQPSIAACFAEAKIRLEAVKSAADQVRYLVAGCAIRHEVEKKAAN